MGATSMRTCAHGAAAEQVRNASPRPLECHRSSSAATRVHARSPRNSTWCAAAACVRPERTGATITASPLRLGNDTALPSRRPAKWCAYSSGYGGGVEGEEEGMGGGIAGEEGMEGEEGGGIEGEGTEEEEEIRAEPFETDGGNDADVLSGRFKKGVGGGDADVRSEVERDVGGEMRNRAESDESATEDTDDGRVVGAVEHLVGDEGGSVEGRTATEAGTSFAFPSGMEAETFDLLSVTEAATLFVFFSLPPPPSPIPRSESTRIDGRLGPLRRRSTSTTTCSYGWAGDSNAAS